MVRETVPSTTVVQAPSPIGRAEGEHAEVRLLRKAADGDEAAFRTLVGQHSRSLLAIGRRMLGETAEAEDMAQEALLRLWRGANQIEVGPAGVRPWLNRVTANLCLDRLRARKSAPQPRAELPEPSIPPTQQRGLETAELSRRVDVALQGLPERQRLALVMFHYEGLSQGEAAEALDVSQEALESLLARARRALKAALADEWKSLLPDGRDGNGGSDGFASPDVTTGRKTGHGHDD